MSRPAAEIEIVGDLDLAVANGFAEALERAAPRWTLVDLARCTLLDSTAIAVVLRENRRRGGSQGRVVLHSPSPPALRLLTLTGLTEDGLVFAARDEAIAALGC